jgi:eukaryotic-like serine/threonine-protein kinase
VAESKRGMTPPKIVLPAPSTAPAPIEHLPTELPPLPEGVSRVDTLPESFVQLLSHRPHLPGDVIAGRYRLEAMLGDGAMGQVFAAVNLAISRRVAIKVLKAEVLADAQFRVRFQQEAEAIARIGHRNVAHFIDLVVGDPTFLVMELVDGPTLGSVLRKEGKLEPRRAIAIAVRLCWALEAAHQAGIVHRDVKPGNILLAPDPELGEEPKLIDFGLAKLASSATDAPTRVGQIVGTPHYMAPEQIANQEIDARADVYALACVLYHMIAGRPPFEGDSDVQLMYQHMQSPPRPLDAFTADVPPGLQAVMARALAKDRGDRFPSMRELAAALGSLEKRRPRAEPRPRPSSVAPVVLGLGALAAVAAAGIGWLAGARERASMRAAPPSGVVVIDTQPPGAKLTLDGQPQATPSPLVLEKLAPGKHALAMTLAGHRPLERTISVTAGTRQVLSYSLPPASHALHVDTTPTGATAFLDGKLQGLTPIDVELSNDDFHELRLEKTGYATVRRGLPPDLSETNQAYLLAPETRAVGRLLVTSDAPLPVFVDGLDTGFLTPTIELELLAGTHIVELRDFDATPVATRKFALERGETKHLYLPRASEKQSDK